jgi:Spy/CpxP family protein refolding chaperone
MKTSILLTVLIILGMTAAVQGQDTLKITDEYLVERQLDRLSRELSLTEVQIQQLQPVLTERMKQLKAVPGNNGQSTGDTGQEKQPDQVALNALKDILSEDQYKLFIQIRKDTRAQKESHNSSVMKSQEDRLLDF